MRDFRRWAFIGLLAAFQVSAMGCVEERGSDGDSSAGRSRDFLVLKAPRVASVPLLLFCPIPTALPPGTEWASERIELTGPAYLQIYHPATPTSNRAPPA